MLSGTLWPAHPHPLTDELLSSWIVRIAEANGVKLETMTHLLFGLYNLPWNHDIDRLAPSWLLEAVKKHTGLSDADISRTTLAGYNSRLFPHPKASGQLRWILPVQIHSTQRDGFGVQFCPNCLATDELPYFRRSWRVALNTFCPDHRVMLHDCCPACGTAITFYRRDFGRSVEESGPICLCYHCQFDLRTTPRQSLEIYEQTTFDLYEELLRSLGKVDGGRFDLAFYAVLHQLCKIILSVRNRGLLRQHIAQSIGITVAADQPTKIPLERRRVFERHQAVFFALWLLANPEVRIVDAWRNKAVRYNVLTKDFSDAPEWYQDVVARCSDWRS